MPIEDPRSCGEIARALGLRPVVLTCRYWLPGRRARRAFVACGGIRQCLPAANGYAGRVNSAVVDWAEAMARQLLTKSPERLQHVVGVARRASWAAGMLEEPDREYLMAAG